MELGPKLKELRRRKGITLQEIADESGLSKSFVSQIESGVTNPSIASLKKIADALDLPLAALFDDNVNGAGDGRAPLSEATQNYLTQVQVVRSQQRKMLAWPGQETKMYLLTPDLQRKLEVTMSLMQPGDSTGEDSYSHQGEERGIVLEGTLEVTVDCTAHVLEAGDSIYFPSHLPHKFRLLGDKPGKTIWVNTPPSF